MSSEDGVPQEYGRHTVSLLLGRQAGRAVYSGFRRKPARFFRLVEKFFKDS